MAFNLIHLSDITSALHLTPPLFIPQVQEEAEEEQESLKALLSAAVAKLSLVSAVHCIKQQVNEARDTNNGHQTNNGACIPEMLLSVLLLWCTPRPSEGERPMLRGRRWGSMRLLFDVRPVVFSVR